MRFQLAFPMALIFLMSFDAPASAEEGSCDAVLAATTIKDNSRKNISLATLDLVTQDNFNSFKMNFSAAGSFPIEGIPVDTATTFDQFRQARQTYREEHKFDYQLSEIKDLSVSFVSDNAINAWIQCISAGKTEVLILRTKYVSDSDIVVHAKWLIGAQIEPGKRKGTPIVIGSPTNPLEAVPAEFPSSWIPMHFKREKNKPFSLDIQLANGNAAHIDLPAYSATFASPVNCLQATENGCAACRIPIDSDLANFGAGSVKSFFCAGMIPSADVVANVTVVFWVLGANSGRTKTDWVISSAGQNKNFTQDNRDDLTGPKVRSQSTQLRGFKTSPIGRASADIQLGYCYWVENAGAPAVQNCPIGAQKGSFIRFDIE
jgi:hypothetical protein